VKQKSKIIVEAEGDAFADTAQVADAVAFCACNRRFRSSKKEWAGDAHA
jgi:hypothetical protein